MSSTTATKPATCGCGGLMTASCECATACDCGSGCSCGSTGATSRPGFQRPRFFGGMLLNESDLQSAIDYMVGKRKLTNRFVFGPGVVCGLDVRPDPCDPAVAIVHPGYGLDCCGNDIVVDCIERLDVIQMVNDLRRNQGLDCGDPCDDNDERTYYLYIRYAETLADPVAPYASDNCAVGDCEFSRVQEGYCFELRCDPFQNEDSMIDLIYDCFRDGMRFREDVSKLKELRQLTSAASVTDDVGSLKLLGPAPQRAEFKEVDVGDQAKVELLLTRSLRHAAAFDLAAAGMETKTDLTRRRRNLNKGYAQELLDDVRSSIASTGSSTSIDVERLARLVDLHNRDLATLSAAERELAQLGMTRLTAGQRIQTLTLEVKNQLLADYESRGLAGTKEYARLSQVKPAMAAAGRRDDVDNLILALLALLQKCVCTSINPRCPTCTDLGVPLAKLTVEGCEVTDICDLERRWVLTPRAIEHWLPINKVAGAVLPAICCEDLFDDQQPAPVDYDHVLDGLESSGQAHALSTTGARAFSMAAKATATMINRQGTIEGLSKLQVREPTQLGQTTPGAAATGTELERRLAAAEQNLQQLSAELATVRAAADGESPGEAGEASEARAEGSGK